MTRAVGTPALMWMGIDSRVRVTSYLSRSVGTRGLVKTRREPGGTRFVGLGIKNGAVTVPINIRVAQVTPRVSVLTHTAAETSPNAITQINPMILR